MGGWQTSTSARVDVTLVSGSSHDPAEHDRANRLPSDARGSKADLTACPADGTLPLIDGRSLATTPDRRANPTKPTLRSDRLRRWLLRTLRVTWPARLCRAHYVWMASGQTQDHGSGAKSELPSGREVMESTRARDQVRAASPRVHPAGAHEQRRGVRARARKKRGLAKQNAPARGQNISSLILETTPPLGT
jgi:hypothetical protein